MLEWVATSCDRRGNQLVPSDTIARQSLAELVEKLRLIDRSEVRDSIYEMISQGTITYSSNELVRLLVVGLKQLPKQERDRFMRSALYELKKGMG
jgi:hypothetical protein